MTFATHHPSGRPATRLRTIERHDLLTGCDTDRGDGQRPVDLMTARDAWLMAKVGQVLEDGTRARIDRTQLARLLDMPCHWPGATVWLVPEAPMVDLTDAPEPPAEARPSPAVTAACAPLREARKTRSVFGFLRPTGGDAA